MTIQHELVNFIQKEDSNSLDNTEKYVLKFDNSCLVSLFICHVLDELKSTTRDWKQPKEKCPQWG